MIPQQIIETLSKLDGIILVGGPSGSGKTSFSQAIIDHDISPPLDIHANKFFRTDAKSIFKKEYGNGILFLEFATDTLISSLEITACKDLLAGLSEITPILHCINIEIPPKTAFTRYLSRMGGMQYLHIGKLKKLIQYAKGSNIHQGNKNWLELMSVLGINTTKINGLKLSN